MPNKTRCSCQNLLSWRVYYSQATDRGFLQDLLYFCTGTNYLPPFLGELFCGYYRYLIKTRQLKLNITVSFQLFMVKD